MSHLNELSHRNKKITRIKLDMKIHWVSLRSTVFNQMQPTQKKKTEKQKEKDCVSLRSTEISKITRRNEKNGKKKMGDGDI